MAFNMHPASNQKTAPFNGILNPSEVYESIFNMIIKQVVKYPELASNYSFVNMFKEEGGAYGDTALFYSQDILTSREWLGDGEAMNLLALERPEDPECQAITINKFRIVKTSTDSYLSKRAWSTESAFSAFTGNVKALVGKTKELYENTMVATRLGTMEGDAIVNELSVKLAQIDADELTLDASKIKAQTIGEKLANLLVDLKNYNRKFNTYEHMRAYNEEDIVFVWNSKWINNVTKQSLPLYFSAQGLIDKFKQHVLPADYFGTVIDDNHPDNVTMGGDGYYTIGAGYKGTIRTLDEGNFTSGHKFPGEALAAGDKFLPGAAYEEDDKIICKVITKDSVKYMSGFSTSTEFFNPQALTTSNMLIWAYAEPTRMLDQPFITVKADISPIKETV